MIRIPENLSTKLSFLVNNCILHLPVLLFRKFHADKNKLILETLRTRSPISSISCWLCDESFSSSQNRYICNSCRKDLPVIGNACLCCSLPVTFLPGTELIDMHQSRHLCGECISQPPGFFCSVASYRYEFPVKQLIHRIKYQKQRYWLKPLASQLLSDIQRSPFYATDPLPEVLIPVPMHPRKQKTRTFNQALLIANYLSPRLNIPVKTGILLKTKLTDNQVSLKKSERIRNLKNAFGLSRRTHKRNMILGKHIALIDDVMTTKATALLATKVLLEAGASRVDIWCLARTPKS